jgi:hypothetical protein
VCCFRVQPLQFVLSDHIPPLKGIRADRRTLLLGRADSRPVRTPRKRDAPSKALAAQVRTKTWEKSDPAVVGQEAMVSLRTRM